MTTLIFATHDDASPLIHLEAERAEIVEVLGILRGLLRTDAGPGMAAAYFLRALSPDHLDEWNPRLESTPIFCVGACADFTVAVDYGDLLAWNPETWAEWDLEALDTTPKVTPKPAPPHDHEALFQEIVAICRPESPAIIEATTKALAKALEAEEQRLANPPGFV